MAHGSPRDSRKAAQWQRRIQQWQRSGQSVRSFCAAQQLSEPSFYAWRRELAKRSEAEPAFVPVRIQAETASSPDYPIEVFLANGRRLRLAAPDACPAALLAQLAAALEEPASC
jgi:transposase